MNVDKTTKVGQLWHYLQWIKNSSEEVFLIDVEDNSLKSKYEIHKQDPNTEKYMKLILLLERTEEELIANGNTKESLSQFYEIRNQLIKFYNQSLTNNKNILNSNDLNFLGHLHNSVKKAASLDAVDLQELATHLQKLFEEISNAPDMDAALKEFLLRHVSNMKRAVDDYSIWGSEGLITSFQSMIGELVIRYDINTKLEKSGFLKNVSIIGNIILAMIGLTADVSSLHDLGLNNTCITYIVAEQPMLELEAPSKDALDMESLSEH
jgi:HPt (histidine-containing phosphotransfer) domain-containing protein